MTQSPRERSGGRARRSPALSDLNQQALVSVAVLSLAISVLLFAMPLYTLQVYDRVMVSRSVETLVFLSLIVMVALGANALLESIRGRILLRIGNAYAVALGPKLLDAAIARSARTSTPDSQPLRHLNTVRQFVVSPQGLSTIFDVPLVLLFLAAVYLIHVPLGHAMVLGISVLLVLTVVTELVTGGPQRAGLEASAAAQKRIDAVLISSEAVEAMGMRPAMRDYWFLAQSQALAQSSLAGDRANAVGGAAKWVRMMLNLMVTAVAAWYVIHDQITLGAMVAANILAARGLAPLESMISAWRGLVNARVAVEHINSALREAQPSDGGTELPAPSGAIAIERLFYSPPGSEVPTLKGVTAAIPAGSWVGIVGPSGAGKTSLANLLCGVWRPASGHVRLDGADVHAWPRTNFGVHCGYLPQTVELFAGTVRDNIARFQSRESVPDAAVVEAAKMAGVHELILRLPKGYETPIGFGGSALSAGQRQRIGLARALLRCPRLLVLDEPNSNLDAEGEAALIVALRKARAQGSTIFLISHRPSLLADADLVGVLVDGQLQHFGSRETVMPKIVPESRRTLTEVRHVQG